MPLVKNENFSPESLWRTKKLMTDSALFKVPFKARAVHIAIYIYIYTKTGERCIECRRQECNRLCRAALTKIINERAGRSAIVEREREEKLDGS